MTNIVMLVRDRYRLTAQSLESLYDGTDSSQFNLTIVDDASEDFRVRRLLHRYYGKSNVSLIHNRFSRHILSQLKNLGVYWSEQSFGRGDWLYLSDNDVWFDPDWLSKLIAAAGAGELHDFNLFGGQAHPFHQPVSTMFITTGISGSVLLEHDCLAGTSWLMRWSTWDEFGPLDSTTAPGVCQSEDYQFTQKLRAAGGRIGVVSPHVVIDCSLTQSDGKPAPGADLKKRVEGVWYE